MSPEATLREFLRACRWRLRMAAILNGLSWAAAVALPAIGLGWLLSWPLTITTTVAGVATAGAAIVAWRLAAAGSQQVDRWIEQRVPESKNSVLTAAELLDEPRRTRPPVVEIVVGHAARIVARRDPRALFPLGRPFTRTLVCVALAVAALFAQARWPSAAAVRVLAGSANTIDGVTIDVAPPAYSGQPASRLTNPAEIVALAGSELRVHVRSRADAVRLETLDAEISMTHEADGFSARFAADRDGLIVLTGTNGAGNGPRRLIGLVVRPDAPPVVRISKPGRDIFVPAAAPLPIEVLAEDDLGLMSVKLTYTTVTGSGENFEFQNGNVPLRLQQTDARHWSGAATLDVPALHLAPGDTVAYRALATDTRPGAVAVESDTFMVHIVAPDTSVLGGFAIDDEMSKYALSQQMIIMKTERLIAQRTSMTSGAFADEASNIATEQRRLRAQFIFMMGAELEDAAAAGALDETNEAVREEEIAAGRLRNPAYVDVVQATRYMGRAAAALVVPDATGGLTEEKSALAALQRAFSKDRYLLRSLSTQERLDESRRLNGRLDDAVNGARPEASPQPNARAAALRRGLASVAGLAASAASDRSASATVNSLADTVIRIDPSSASLRAIATQLSSASGALLGGRITQASGDLERAALAIVAELRSMVPAAPDVPGSDKARLQGALSDALRRKGGR